MPTVCWRLSAWGPDIASTRYRAAIPALHLVEQGVASRFSWGPHGVLEADPPDVLVFVKTFSERDLELAREAAAAGVAVVLDVCDNVFAPGYQAHSPDNLRRMAELAAALVTTGPALARVLRAELGDDLPLHEIPDPVETPADVRATVRLLWRARLGRAVREAAAGLPLAAAAALRRELVPALRRRRGDGAAAAGPPQLLWFGNAGSVQPRFGIVNLVDIAAELQAAHAEVPFRLLVVSGTRDAYR